MPPTYPYYWYAEASVSRHSYRKNAPHLDGDYAAFGKLIEGEDILDKIAGVDTDYSDRPRKPQVMKTVTVETFGEEYPEPEKL